VAEREVGLQAALKIDSPRIAHPVSRSEAISHKSGHNYLWFVLTISGSGVVGQTFGHELRAITH
jgi:hypothetical protein